MRNVEFHPRGLADLQFWIAENRKLAERVLALVDACARDPFRGPGKPEPLKGNLKGCRSRRITAEHRLVYRVSDDRISILQCRFHYE